MNKGFNTLVKETKGNIREAINNGLKAGLPISVIDLIMDGVIVEVKMLVDKAINEELKKQEQGSKVPEGQIPYEPTPITGEQH